MENAAHVENGDVESPEHDTGGLSRRKFVRTEGFHHGILGGSARFDGKRVVGPLGSRPPPTPVLVIVGVLVRSCPFTRPCRSPLLSKLRLSSPPRKRGPSASVRHRPRNPGLKRRCSGPRPRSPPERPLVHVVRRPSVRPPSSRASNLGPPRACHEACTVARGQASPCPSGSARAPQRWG
jgi:hypothetical protein